MLKRMLIVGAGPGGWAAALLLAQAGREATLLKNPPRVDG